MVSLGLNLKINTSHGQMLCVALAGSSWNMRMHYVLHSTRGSTGNGSLERKEAEHVHFLTVGRGFGICLALLETGRK